ncbi:MAG: ASKHA domain-containing protein [Actinomycetota bacterium]|nr:ASKHA domain-containing protein [Actinomycetota bacterium]
MAKEKIEPELVEHSGLGRVKLDFAPSNQSFKVPPGVSVFDAASWNGIAIDSTCGGHGTCKKCKVQITEGIVPISRLDIRAFNQEELKNGWRLACVARATENLAITIPAMATRPKAATVGVGRQVILRPAVQKRYIELVEPTLHDQRPDIQRVKDAIDDLEVIVEFGVLQKLPTVLRKNDFKVTVVVVDDVLIDVEPGDTTEFRYAIAYDLGTTTVVATLLDLNSGTPIGVKSMLNKQQPFGADVISRISATMLDENALSRLRNAAQSTLDELTQEVIKEAKVDKDNVYEVAIAGNATMIQLILGVDPEPVGVAPFITASQYWPVLNAKEFGINIHPQARAYSFPSLGAYVGGDIVAGVLASGMDRDKRVRLFIDVGTNCEIVLSDGNKIITTAAPAGPAFEAASIKCGMRAADGAIEVVKITKDGVTLQVIGEVEPQGMCGSGLVDAVAELAKIGVLDQSGRFISKEELEKNFPKLSDRLIDLESTEKAFILHGDRNDPLVYLTQRDVRELQFAKASIATGWRLLMEQLNLKDDDIQQVLLAGSFGSYLSPASAIQIGLVPKIPVMRIVSAGNVAGEGAKMVLLSQPERNGANALLNEVEYVELSDRADFNDKFVVQLGFPK